jgi:hypothetical protein
MPVNRPAGRALIVATASNRAQPLGVMQRLGYTCAEADDPYAAAVELSRRPLVYRAVILSLTSLHKEEMSLVGMIKQRLPHMEIWLTHTDGRQAALAEGMRLGADGLLTEDGLHRTAITSGEPAKVPPPKLQQTETAAENSSDPVLTAEELRALLDESPVPPNQS